MALGLAMKSPWRSAGELRLGARIRIWAYAFDDWVEQDATSLAGLDQVFEQCMAVVRTGRSDNSHPLLSALSDCQQEFDRLPSSRRLAPLWVQKFGETLESFRYKWIASQDRDHGHAPADVQEYLAHAGSVMMSICCIAQWASYEHTDVLDHLDVLAAALIDVELAVRLANDLATAERERLLRRGQNNILQYGVSKAWVRTEIARNADTARHRLMSLVRAGNPPAVELLRLLEWSISFYARGDLRGWGSGESSANMEAR
jgi:hypothetical protein